MATAIRYGVILGVLVEVWTYVMGYTGWYRDPKLVPLFFLVIPLEIVLVVLALRRTAAVSSYGQQLLNALVLCLVASAIIFAGSMVFTTVAFPRYFQELEAMGRQQMAAAGQTAEQIEAAIAAQRPMQTPLANAFAGVAGTTVTGMLVALIAAIPLRRRGSVPA